MIMVHIYNTGIILTLLIYGIYGGVMLYYSKHDYNSKHNNKYFDFSSYSVNTIIYSVFWPITIIYIIITIIVYMICILINKHGKK